MTTEQEILSFEKKLEQRNFILDDKLLEQLLERKMSRLREQSELDKELRRLTRRHK
jgi:hypothetical protein